MGQGKFRFSTTHSISNSLISEQIELKIDRQLPNDRDFTVPGAGREGRCKVRVRADVFLQVQHDNCFCFFAT